MDDQSLQILVVDDDSTELLLLKAALNDVRTAKFVLTGVKRLDEALRCLHDKHFDAVLLHLGLPDSQGLETFTKMQRAYPSIPILIFSGRSDEDLAIQAVQAGAQDLVAKGDFKGILLARSIRYAIERKSSEQRLTASEASYRRLFESAHDGIFILEAETGQITDANPYIEELLGYTISEFIGKRLWEIAPFRDKAANQAAFRTLQEKGYIRYEDLPLMTRSGEQIAVEFVSNVYDVGTQRVIQCNIRDIRERKRAETAEMELQRFLQSTLNALGSHIAVLNESGEIIAVNQAWQQFAAENEGSAVTCGIGANYLDVCDRAQGLWSKEAAILARGLREVIAGQQQIFCLEYPCHSPIEERWFNACVTRFVGEGPTRVVVAHENITAHKRAEKLVSVSEANLAKSQEMAHLGSWELDLTNLDDINSNPLRWSDEIFRILGYAPGEFEPTNDAFFRAVHPDDRENLSRIMAEAVQGGKPYSVDHRIIWPDGEERIIHAQSEVIYDAETGQPVKMVGLGQDITERKQAENELRDSNEKFYQLVDNINDAFWIRSADMSEVLYLSPAFERIWGRPAENLYANSHQWTDFVFPEDSERVRAAFSVDACKVSGVDVEYRILRPDGEIRWIHSRGFPVRDADNQVIRYTGVVTDITESKSAKEALEERTREIVTTWESMTDAFFSLDSEWRFTHVNQQAALLWHRNAEELIGKNIWEEFPVAVGTKFQAEYSRAATEQVAVSFEAFYEPDNAWREVHVYPSAIGLSVYFRDITQRKQAEQNLQRQAQDLARSNDELERFNRLAVGRELRMVELKQQLNDFSQQLGKPRPYKLDFLTEAGIPEANKANQGSGDDDNS